jgi:hypothetical protein
MVAINGASNIESDANAADSSNISIAYPPNHHIKSAAGIDQNSLINFRERIIDGVFIVTPKINYLFDCACFFLSPISQTA